MADLFYVRFVAYNVSHRIGFEHEEKARRFADDMANVGYQSVKVFDEFDPRRFDDDGTVQEIEPIYEPAD